MAKKIEKLEKAHQEHETKLTAIEAKLEALIGKAHYEGQAMVTRIMEEHWILLQQG